MLPFFRTGTNQYSENPHLILTRIICSDDRCGNETRRARKNTQLGSELKIKTIRAGAWSLVEALTMRGVQFVVGIILARLLLPEQFGLIGMLMVFTALAQTLMDSGFGAALIQKQDLTEKDINSIFYFNILTGVLLVCCLYVVSPWIATFYDQPILSPLLRLISLTLIINALGLVQNVLIVRELNFKIQAKVTFIASILSGVIGISMAYQGYGVWSLAAQQISSSIFRTILLWLFSSWRPAWIFSFKSLREMFRFGSKLLAAGVLNTFFDNVYLIVIGKLFPLAELGYFTRAKNLQQLPSTTLSSVVSRVTFPVFSAIQDDPERIKRGMKKALTMLVFINFPMMLGLAVVSRPLVLVLLTEKWTPCIPYLQLLCLVGVMFPLHVINLNVLQAMGKSDLFLRLEIIKKSLVVLNIVITYRWGISAMIYGQLVISFFSYYLNAYYNTKLIDYSLLEQISDLCPYLLTAVIMTVAIYGITYLPINNPSLLLIGQTISGFALYLTLCHIFKLTAYTEMKRMVADRFPAITTY